MNKYISPYYPRRARWYSRLLYLGLAARHRLTLDQFCLPKDVTVGGIILGFLIPGFAVYLRSRRFWGKIAVSVCLFLFLVFIVWLGYPVGNFAFGLMLSVHASGFVFYCSPCLLGWKLSRRLIFTLLVLMGIGFGFYLPIQHAIQTHWLMPLRNGNQVIIVSIQHNPASLKLGDWAAFSTDHNVLFGPIVGLGGDRVGSVAVPENHWLIRTQIARRYYHHGSFAGASSDIIEQLTIVSPEEFVGKPFKRWFWRKQILP